MAARVRMLRGRYGHAITRLSTPAWSKAAGLDLVSLLLLLLLLLVLLLGRLLLEAYIHEFLRYCMVAALVERE